MIWPSNRLYLDAFDLLSPTRAWLSTMSGLVPSALGFTDVVCLGRLWLQDGEDLDTFIELVFVLDLEFRAYHSEKR